MTRSEFRAWVATQPPERPYDYTSPWTCPIATFLNATGVTKSAIVDPNRWTCAHTPRRGKVPANLNDAVLADPHTYGALLERLTP